ncbi:SctK family type III secretion system sorting platform protein [Desulfovibrio inopinatus]|uniref:SctK family type III secretion system sorting platform protein n=1 Tax=Desulfovibrio inopinatus TaxID=102109 RepID=UPI000426B073|nr:SctK family type III secretion system sorting platform protein [Desulfovibrio inopinatus]
MPNHVWSAIPPPWDTLGPLVVAFNIGLTPHISQYSKLAKTLSRANLLTVMKASPRGAARLNRHLDLLVERGSDEESLRPYYDFEEHWTRLALLDVEEILRLACLFGLAIDAKTVARRVDKETVMALKQRFGKDAYIFAVKRAAFLPSGELEEARAVLGAAAPTKIGGEALCNAIEEHGMAGLRLCFHGAPAPLLWRLSLKLPLDIFPVSVTSTSIEDSNAVARIRSLFLKICSKEVDPRWVSCFC